MKQSPSAQPPEVRGPSATRLTTKDPSTGPSQKKLDTSSTQNKLRLNDTVGKRTKTEREVVFKSTDFGSKGLYRRTTTLGGKTDLYRWLENKQTWEAPQNATHHFRETANLRLSGQTFDSNHLSKFMQKCPFAEQSEPHYVQRLREAKDESSRLYSTDSS